MSEHIPPYLKQIHNLSSDAYLLNAVLNLITTDLLSDDEVDQRVRNLPDAPVCIWNANSEGLNFLSLENLARISRKTDKKQILFSGCPQLEKNFKIWQEVEKKYNWQDDNIGIIFSSSIFSTFQKDMMNRYISDNLFDHKHKFSKRFLFLNHNDKLERACMLGLLSYRNLLGNFYLSYCKDPRHWPAKPDDPDWPLGEEQVQGLSWLQYPQRLDTDEEWFDDPDHDCMWDLQPSIQPFYKDSAIGIVSETNFWTSEHLKYPEQTRELTYIAFLEHAMFTEKTLKYICAKRPFIQMNIAGCLDDFRELGFKSFAPYIDETYDTIKSESKRIVAIADEVERLCLLSKKEFSYVVDGCSEIAKHNYDHLKKFVDIPVGYNLD